MNFFQRIVLHSFISVYPVKIYRKENLAEGGAVLVCNHLRGIDPGFVARLYCKDIKFLAKKEIFKGKLLAKIIKSFGAVPIDRDKPDLKTMMSLIKYVKDGHKIVVFPEGTRNKTGTTEIQEIKDGAAFFAIKAKKPIVPLCIYKPSRAFRKTHLMVGKPFELSEYYDKKPTDQDFIDMNKIIYDKMVEVQKDLVEFMENKKKKKKAKKSDKKA